MAHVSHQTIKEMCGLTMLVYNYAELFMHDNTVTTELQSMSEFIAKLEQTSYNIDDKSKVVLQDVAEQSPNGSVEMFISDKTTDIQVGITRSDTNQRISVVFCGTQSRSDWYYNLMFSKISLDDDVHVHKGFYTQLHATGAYDSIVDKLVSLMKQYPTYQVFLCGHSLGGALATLFGYEFKNSLHHQQHQQPIAVVSFGSPCVGDYNFTQQFEATAGLYHYRVVNNRDCMIAMPPYNYSHCGKNICMYANSVEIYSSETISWWKHTILYYWSTNDHSISMYYDRLDKLIHCEVY